MKEERRAGFLSLDDRYAIGCLFCKAFKQRFVLLARRRCTIFDVKSLQYLTTSLHPPQPRSTHRAYREVPTHLDHRLGSQSNGGEPLEHGRVEVSCRHRPLPPTTKRTSKRFLTYPKNTTR